MRRHYLKIPVTIQQYFPGGAPIDWRQKAFDDATECGTRLTFHQMPPNALGPRVAVYGDTYYFEMGRDRERSDTLFLTRIELAHMPSVVPTSLPVAIRTWPGPMAAVLDPVDDIIPPEEDADVHAGMSAATPVEPSPLLLAALADIPAEVRERFRPQEAAGPAVHALKALRPLWSRHRLDRILEASPRQEMLLRGGVTPVVLDDDEADGLATLFGFSLLNRVAASGPEIRAELERILRSLADVPDAPLRLGVWAALCARLQATALRRELYDSRAGLASLSARAEVRLARVVATIVLPLLRSAAKDAKDAELATALGGSFRDLGALAAISSWASELSFSEPDAVASVDLLPTVEPHEHVDLSGARSTVLETWSLRLRGLDRARVTAEAEWIQQAVDRARGAIGPADCVAALPTLVGAVEQLRADAAAWLDRLPNPRELAADREEAHQALQALEAALGPDAAAFVDAGDALTPREVNEIAALLAHVEDLQLAPSWLWTLDVESTQASPGDGRAMAERLAIPEVRAAMRTFVDCLVKLGQPVAARWLAPLPAGREVTEHLTDWFEKAQQFFIEAPPEIQQVLRTDGAVEGDLNLLLANVSRLSRLRESVSSGVLDDLLTGVSTLTADAKAIELEKLLRAVDFFRTQVGSLDGIEASAIRNRAQRDAPDRAGTPVLGESSISIDHNTTDAHNARATLTLVHTPAGYAEVAVPLVLETTDPSTASVAIEWLVKGRRESWPADWPDPSPATLALKPSDWRQTPAGHWQHTFTAILPIRAPRTERLVRLEAVATVRDPASRRQLSESKQLRWDQIEDRHTEVVVQWADATDPDYIREHPIGPQEKHRTILQRLTGGSSVAVIAPRRFGKSTLAEYLTREAPGAGLAMPVALWCTEFWSPSAFNYQGLWERVSNMLKSLLGAEVGSGRDGYLPSAEAFDHVREVAKEKGYKAIVLLFDEAQLFFPAQGNHELSSKVKMLLESRWARSEKGKVPLLLAFVGLPSLRQRVGADLMAVLNPIEKSEMEESELKPLIAHTVTGLQTTREARQHLASSAGNLFILRALLERLKDHVNKEQRCWASFDDVHGVEGALRRDLQKGMADSETVATYVRDILNEAERVEEWRPVAAFPVAVAIAQEGPSGRGWTDVESRVVDLLNAWCAEIANEDVRPTYDAAQVSLHVQQLRERGVLRDGKFASRLLEAWLIGVAARLRGGFDEPFRVALMRGAQRRIVVPEGATKLAVGGQAEIFRQDDKAYRIKQLSSETDRLHYLEAVRVMESVKDLWESREAGADHIFEPIDIGLSARNSVEAVQVYRWVEGRDLSDSQGKVSVEAIVDIGLKLARAVALLHQHNILHRDISPRNVILRDKKDDDSVNPVLIDFGFARMAEGPSATVFLSEHLAPEVKQVPALWSKSSDVFGLASTLNWLLVPTGGDKLRRMFARAMADEAGSRPDMAALCLELEGLGVDLSLDQRNDAAWREIVQAQGRDAYSAWIPRLMRECKSSLVSVRMGYSADSFDRCRAVSDFLNKVTEACPRGPKFHQIVTRAGSDGRAVTFVKHLRHGQSHANSVLFEDTRRVVEEFKSLPWPEQRRLLLVASGCIGKSCQFPSLEAIAALLLGPQ